ncbi:hypothetical protein BS47DRAFT_1035845 [Hydnum rufescens UP504]|uniref:Secreted protein n=1 Tax=Hydnum rufescens UP504 TaxID=1448309 RepID=A0A9P6AVL4_9AGAM|nr:hypothetical protein BS47DRAFT_1035845 [Hydnum rufescens UP504]
MSLLISIHLMSLTHSCHCSTLLSTTPLIITLLLQPPTPYSSFCLLSVLQVARHSHTGRPHLFLQHLCLLASSPVFHFYTISRLSCSGLFTSPPFPHLFFLCPQPCHASCAMPS